VATVEGLRFRGFPVARSSQILAHLLFERGDEAGRAEAEPLCRLAYAGQKEQCRAGDSQISYVHVRVSYAACESFLYCM